MFGLFAFTIWMSGMDTAVGYTEGWVTNIIDHTGYSRTKVSIFVTITGIILSTLFTSNWGFVLLDTVDHFMSVYIVFSVALMQCISVGWIFERETTS